MSIHQPDSERRSHTDIRAVFAEAYETIAPFFDPQGQWAGRNHEHLAFHALKERFPSLTAQDALIVVATARRIHASARPVARS